MRSWIWFLLAAAALAAPSTHAAPDLQAGRTVGPPPPAGVQLAQASPAPADRVHEPDMVRIPGGTFSMGTSYAEDARENMPAETREDSKPQHNVTVQAFLLARTTVTRRAFAAFIRAAGERPSNGIPGVRKGCYGYKLDDSDHKWKFELNPALDWRHPGFDQTDDDPVVCVNYDDALAYAAWLGTVTGKAYRLPTEAEWEYAARGVAHQKAARFWGDERASACAYANVADAELRSALDATNDPDRFFGCSDGHAYTAPVGSFKPNDYGLYDMLGNVWQWTVDCWNDNYDKASTDGTAATIGDCGLRVQRGGSWVVDPWGVRSGIRLRDGTGNRNTDSGFRLAGTL